MESLHDRRALLTPHLVFGLIIIAVGILFTLDNLGLADAERYFRLWPSGVILVGLAKLWSARRGSGNAVGGVFFVLVGGWLQLDALDLMDRELWNFWPLILVFIGTLIVYQGIRGKQSRQAAEAGDVVAGVAILGGLKRVPRTTTFRGGELTAVMGGCEIDLRNAEINGDAVIDVFVMWGGIDIKVPKDWEIVIGATAIMGAVEDNSERSTAPGPHRLTIRGFVLMGGVDIKS